MRCYFNSRKWKRLVGSLTALCFLAFSVLALPSRSRAFNLSDEKELGRKILEKIREQLPLVEDGEILTYVQSVGNRIVKEIGSTHYQYQFFVINESVPNAFAIPGGYIFLYRGLIELMATEGELASILSHELAHIQARHIERRMKEGRILSVAALAGMLAGVLLGMKSDASQAVAIGGIAGARSFELKYSRENEEEADQLGFRYLCAAGYPPEEMASVMQRLSQGRWRENSRVPSYLSTHPALSERIQYLRDLVQKQRASAPKAERAAPLGDFAMMQAALVSEYADPQVAMDKIEASIRKGEPAGSYGLGRLYLRQGKLSEAMTALQEAARKSSASPFVLSTLGAAYIQQGKMEEARRVLQTALTLDPSASIVHLRLALVLQEIGQRDEAIRHLHQIEELAPMFPEIDYHLGVLLGQVGRMGMAHFHLGRYYENRQDWEPAFFHYTKAKAMITDSPMRLSELELSLKDIEKRKKEAFWEKARKQQLDATSGVAPKPDGLRRDWMRRGIAR